MQRLGERGVTANQNRPDVQIARADARVDVSFPRCFRSGVLLLSRNGKGERAGNLMFSNQVRRHCSLVDTRGDEMLKGDRAPKQERRVTGRATRNITNVQWAERKVV